MAAWRGVFPAVTTKLRQDESVDLEATQQSLDRLIDNGVSGVIVLPMLGENASLTLEERDSVITAAKEAVAGRVPLLSGPCRDFHRLRGRRRAPLRKTRRRGPDGLPLHRL